MVASTGVCLDSRERVVALISAMAGMVETAVDQAIHALLAGDVVLAQALLQREPAINSMEMHIDAAILAHLGEKHLGHNDIRYFASMLKVNKDLERIGDLAANIGRKVMDVACSCAASHCSDLQPIAITVSHICRKTLRALVHQDRVLAESVSISEETLHSYRDYVFRRIHERLRGGSPETDSDVALLLASRYLEQIADHAINLAGNLMFWLRGGPGRQTGAVSAA